MSEAVTSNDGVDRSRKLTSEQVAIVRLGIQPDKHFAQLWHIGVTTIRMARIGRTHKQHPVPPQTAKRPRGGLYRRAA